MLRQSAQQLNERAAELRRLGEQVWQAAAGAPSYDGQFGPKARALAEQGRAQLNAQAARLGSLSDELLARAEAFEAADLETQTAFQRLGSAFQDWFRNAGFLAPFARLAGMVGLGNLVSPGGGGGAGETEAPPWWVPVLLGISRGWFDLDERVLSPLRDTLVRLPQTWSQNLEYVRILATFYSAQAQAWIDVHVGQPIEELISKLPAFQEPGLPADGPLTTAMLTLSAVDSNGNPISQVGHELVQLIDARGGVTVTFSDPLTGGGGAGVAPVKGVIWLPERYASPAMQSDREIAALVGHELAHVLQRDLPEFPDGWGPAGAWIYAPKGLDPVGLTYGSPIGGDFTLYMEVQSNIVQKTIVYDFLQNEASQYPVGDPARAPLEQRMGDIADSIATYIGDSTDASAYVVQEHPSTEMYTGEMVKEVILGSRIPEASWQELLAAQGFSQESINHMADIGASGTPQDVPIARFLQGTNQSVPAPSPGTAPAPNPTPRASPRGLRPD